MCLQISELRELAKVALGGGRIETKMTDDFFYRNLVFIGHELHNIDQFLCQRGLYRPLSYFGLVDNCTIITVNKGNRIRYD